MLDVLQYSIDIVETQTLDENELRRILEDAGFIVKGISWNARWTEEGYDNGEAPISYN